MTKVAKILFIDDDPVCTFINKSLVEELGLAKEVVSLPNAEDALLYIQVHYALDTPGSKLYPDLIFLDIRMPGMNGFDFLDALDKAKNIDRSRFLIILLTASLHPSDRDKAYAHNDMVHAYLTKPLEIEAVENLMVELYA